MDSKFKTAIKIKGANDYFLYFLCHVENNSSSVEVYLSKDKDIYHIILYTYYSVNKNVTLDSSPMPLICYEFINYYITPNIVRDNIKIALNYLKYSVVNNKRIMDAIEKILKNRYGFY